MEFILDNYSLEHQFGEMPYVNPAKGGAVLLRRKGLESLAGHANIEK
jgi:hypothetical protein